MRPRIQWQVLDDVVGLCTEGWLPDSPTLRWSLTDAIRVEGLYDQRSACYEAAERATVHDGYVAETDLGDLVEVTYQGVHDRTGERYEPVRAATIAIL